MGEARIRRRRFTGRESSSSSAALRLCGESGEASTDTRLRRWFGDMPVSGRVGRDGGVGAFAGVEWVEAPTIDSASASVHISFSVFC